MLVVKYCLLRLFHCCHLLSGFYVFLFIFFYIVLIVFFFFFFFYTCFYMVSHRLSPQMKGKVKNKFISLMATHRHSTVASSCIYKPQNWNFLPLRSEREVTFHRPKLS
ncbi:hypothetical protein NL108_006078 [Boleophthalmus pectinirostris]|nr:hypothetical protein NL108_006078 [Boleophthalmus pectinirostris]